ncbi:MAG: hypothetical protein D3909_17415, partial [Candidatus Electrothrix sp. ATG1]|nr:hypothetical protein [Candidatus Electrothrix sp. ATG1]
MPGQERILICLVVVVIISASIGTWLYRTRNKLPDTIRIASGTEGGEYNNFGDSLGKKLSVRTGRTVKNIETAGTMENLKLLKEGVVEVALLQSIVFPDPDDEASDSISVIAPLYLEPVVVLARKESGIETLYDLESRSVCTGPEESGTKETSDDQLKFYGLKKVRRVHAFFHDDSNKTDKYSFLSRHESPPNSIGKAS